MKKFLRIGFFSVALSQCLYGVDATEWWQLDENQTNPPPDTLVIYENSTLNITTTNAPQNGAQQFNGSITFNHNLDISLTINGQMQQDQSTPIYRLNNADGIKNFDGTGTLTLNIDSQGTYAKSIFNFDGANNGLNLNVKTKIIATEGSQIFSIFRNGGSTININNDFIVDLSNTIGVFNNKIPQDEIINAKTIFDNGGTTNVNPNGNAKVQLTGDVANFGGVLTINLTNTDSFFKGRVEAVNTSTTNFNLSGGSSAEINLTSHNRNNASPNFSLNLSGDSVAKITTNIHSQAAVLTYSTDHSSLYADFIYQAGLTAQGNITISNEGTWFLGQSNTIAQLTINNPQANLTKDNFEHLRNLASVDFRYRDQGATARTSTTLDENSRYTLSTAQIQGSNGVFRFFGVFNRDGWTKVTDQATNTLQETIATDQIITGTLFNTHYIQLFWNQNNFDKSLLNANLENDKIVVARQTGMAGGNNFVGAVTPIGVYNYITNLKKEIYTFNDANGAQQQGWQWIISDVQRADNSYLSRLLDSLFQSQFRIEKTQIDTLNLRMGELRKLNRVHSVWVRTKYGRLGSKETDQTIGSWDEYASLWIGYDQNFYVLGGKNFLGGSFDVQFFNSYGLPSEDDTANPSYTGKSQSYGFSIYDTYFFDCGFYIDALAKYYFTHNRFTIASEVLAGNIPDFFTHNFLASVEIGQRFNLPLSFYIKPDAGMSFAFNSGQDWNFMDWSNQSIKARLDFNSPVNLRTGVTAGWTFNSRGYEGDLYIGTSFEYDFNTGGDLRLEDFLDKMTLSHAGNFNWRINAGTNIILNEYWRIYFDVDTAFFGTINSTFTLNGGVRINFGRLHPQMPYIPPRFEAPEEFRKYPTYRRTIPEVQNYETQNILDNYKGMTKIRKLPPKIDVKSKPYNQDTTPNTESLQQFSITPQVQKQPQGDPVFIDNPQEINAPSKNYKREQNVPISPSVNPQGSPRTLQNIKENLNRGF